MRLILNKALDNINDNVNLKIIEITSTDFLNNDLDYFVYKYQIPLIKFTDTKKIFNIKNFKIELSSSLSEMELILTESDLELLSGGGGGSQDLQSVLDNGQYANAQINLIDGNPFISRSASGNMIQIGNGSVDGYNFWSSSVISIDFTNRTAAGNMMLTFDPNKPNGMYRIATLDDIKKIDLTGRVYANNAAAISGGLTVNDVYRTSTGELRIVV